MTVDEAINDVAAHLWLHHRALITGHRDYANILYFMYKKAETICHRSNLGAVRIAKLANTRRILYWHKTDLEKAINVKYRRPNSRRDYSYHYDGGRIPD